MYNLKIKSTASLDKEVKEELKIEDPELNKVRAIFDDVESEPSG